MSQQMPGGFVYVVEPGDTLGNIAARFGVTVAAILRANPSITDPNQLSVGQQVFIPSGGPGPTQPRPGQTVYIVRSGDTLSAIARRFGVTVDQIVAANPIISDPNNLTVGLRLVIPGRGAVPGPAPGPGGGFIHVIQAGETLWSLSQRFGVSVDAIVRANPGINPNQLTVGQRIRIPGRGPAPGPRPGGFAHVVQTGDTIWSLSQRYGVSMDAIIRANPQANPNQLQVGQVLRIPRG